MAKELKESACWVKDEVTSTKSLSLFIIELKMYFSMPSELGGGFLASDRFKVCCLTVLLI